MLAGQLSPLIRCFRNSFQAHQLLSQVGPHGHNGIRILVRLREPPMGFQDAVDIRLAAQFDEVAGLVDIRAVESFVGAKVRFNSHSVVFRFYVLADFLHEAPCSLQRGGTSGEIVYLSHNNYFFPIDLADVDISLMRSVAETHLVDNNIRNHSFPESSCFWMPLQRLEQRYHLIAAVQSLPELAVVPFLEFVINFQETGNGWWGRLLVGIVHVPVDYVVPLLGTDCEE